MARPSGGSSINLSPVEVPAGPTDTITALHFYPSTSMKTLFAASSWDKNIYVYEYQVGNYNPPVSARAVGKREHSQPVLGLSIAPDGRIFFGGSCNGAHVWDVNANTTSQVAAHDAPIQCLSYLEPPLAPQPMLITGGWDRKVRFWDLRSPNFVKEEMFDTPIVSMDCKGMPGTAAFLPTRQVVLYDLRNFSRTSSFQIDPSMKFACRCLATSQNSVLYGGTCGRIGVIQSSGTNKAFKVHCEKMGTGQGGLASFDMYGVNFIASLPNSPNRFAVGGSNGKVKFLEVSQSGGTPSVIFETPITQRRPQSLSGRAPGMPISCGTAHDRDPLLLYAASYDWSLGYQKDAQSWPKSIYLLKYG